MFKLTVLEFLLRNIPESLIYMLFSYLFANKDIDKKRYFVSSLLFTITKFWVKHLPIDCIFYIITTVALYIPICALINKLYVYKVVHSIVFIRLVQFIFEWVNIVVLVNIFKFDIQIIFKNPLMMSLYLIPSLILLGLMVLLFHIYKTKKEGRKNVFNSKSI